MQIRKRIIHVSIQINECIGVENANIERKRTSEDIDVRMQMSECIFVVNGDMAKKGF
jgi:hypothetical protein